MTPTTTPFATGIDSVAFTTLQRSLDVDEFWDACLKVLSDTVPFSICSLFFDISNYHPRRAKHHVVESRKPDYVRSNSLTIAGPYLEAHPDQRMYTYSQIRACDPLVTQRRLEQEPDPEWDEFLQMAFWRDGNLEAILGVAWNGSQNQIGDRELRFLEMLYPVIDASLYRLRALDSERLKCAGLESALERMPIAVMMVGFNGDSLFANGVGRRQCERWNASLGHHSVRYQLPRDLDEVLEDSGESRDDGETVIKHPFLPDFSVRIGVSWHTPGLQSLPCYVLVFQDGHSDALKASSASTQSNRRTELLQKLSPKERRVAMMVAEGLRNEEIATRLCRSRRTIEFQLGSVFCKLDISNRLQLIKLLG